MAFKFGVGNVGEITDNNIWVRNCGLYIDFLFVSYDRVNCIRIRMLSFFQGIYLSNINLSD